MPESNAASSTPQRLQKIIAAAGLASRRKAETLITEGRVRVNGQIVTELGAKADPARDHIRVDGKLLQGAEQPRYYMLNKPKGYVTTVSDPEKRPTVMKFFERAGARVFPVGRLDYMSEGLLLMTNDGTLANALTRAAAHVEKTYLVKVSGHPTDAAIEATPARHHDRARQAGRRRGPRADRAGDDSADARGGESLVRGGADRGTEPAGSASSSRRLAITSRRFVASATARWCWMSRRARYVS